MTLLWKPKEPVVYTHEDYDNAVKLLLNYFVKPVPKMKWMYHEESDMYFVSQGINLYINFPGPLVRNALPIVKSGVRKWT